MILDIHTHKPAPQPEAVVSLPAQAGVRDLLPGQCYSVGIHPWDCGSIEDRDALLKALRSDAERNEMVVVGECGIDLSRPDCGPLFRQMQLFKAQIEISEEVGKPLIIHDVKAHDIIAGVRRDMRPAQNWAIHGFRRNAATMEMLLRAGCFISFGAEFNPDAVRECPADRLLAETDESGIPIEEVIALISEAREEEICRTVEANTAVFLGFRPGTAGKED